MSEDKSKKKKEKPTILDKKMAKDPNYLKKLELDMLNAQGLMDNEDDPTGSDKEKK